LMLRFIKGSDLLKRLRVPMTFLAGCCFLSLLSFYGYPQIPESLPVIAKIHLQVDYATGSEEMMNFIPVEEGEPFSLKRITESIKQIYKTGLFSDIRVEKEGEQQVILTFLLTRKLQVRRIDFSGEAEIPRKKLREGLHILRDGAFSEDNLARSVAEIRKILTKEGFFKAEIKPIIEKDAAVPLVDVEFMILSAKKYIVNKVDFTGDLVQSQQALRKIMHTKEGKQFIPSELDQDLERLRQSYQSIDYRRAEVQVIEQKFDDTQGYVSLLLQVLPQEKIEIQVQGADVPLDLLRPIWEAQIFEEWGIAEGEAKIIRFMRGKGYLFASVESSVQHEDNLMRVIHKVTPGQHYKIQAIDFEGLNYFDPKQIKQNLLMNQSFPLFRSVDGARLFEFPREIELFYKSHGFSETRVELNFEKEGQKLKPILHIQEGEQQKIESVSVAGATLVPENILLEQIGSVPDGPFFQPDIQKDIQELSRYYLNEGVRGTEISAAVQQVRPDRFSVRFEINEGQKIQIASVVVTGNEATRKNTITRELLLGDGDYARYDAIRETKRRLERLGIFTEVNIEEIPISPERENLLVRVREGARNYASLGVGMETKEPPKTFAVWNNVYRPRGTAEYIRYNVFGLAAQASLVGQLSLREKRGVFSWRQPYFFGLPMETYLNAWLEQEERTSFTYKGVGASLTTIKHISTKENMDFLTTLRLARRTLVKLEISESEIDRKFFPFSTTSISGSYIWERRDDPFNPTQGFFFSSALEWAFPYFKAESDFIKTFNKFQYYISIFPGFTLASTVRIGLAKGRVPIHERFFAGGSNSFRGTEFDQLGPKDPESEKPVGGKALLLFNFELTFPILSAFKDLQGAIFYDKGNVFDRRKQVSLAGLRDALGFGLRYRTPLGPVRLELGWNLDRMPGEKNILGFITIGNVF
jgi:outer membrane protein insertion porin family